MQGKVYGEYRLLQRGELWTWKGLVCYWATNEGLIFLVFLIFNNLIPSSMVKILIFFLKQGKGVKGKEDAYLENRRAKKSAIAIIQISTYVGELNPVIITL